jgi:hypothetical protein
MTNIHRLLRTLAALANLRCMVEKGFSVVVSAIMADLDLPNRHRPGSIQRQMQVSAGRTLSAGRKVDFPVRASSMANNSKQTSKLPTMSH